ncbi:GntR family transcriptional regulator [Kibdelosporangium aridum]|uniref:GntR family transcriptional regulator n=1 Tax=Kibdelosporangium aridum TaxID=2030 RepID=A0A428Z8N0_KIBAR|nr:GntR family transcriptional regulator [Kibdelosporangium aridum]RSM84354.1 GntR family transcriptional regulator [Kibdelosporangium aridum]
MVDRTSGVPAYRQIADDLRSQIESGQLAPGSPLPSERDLVETYDASRPTIREAVKLLRNSGLVVAQHGRGVFVRSHNLVTRLARTRLSRSARAENKGAFMGDAAAGDFVPNVSVEVRVEAADERIADLLNIRPGAEVLVRDRVMRADNVVAQLAVSRLPRDLTQGTVIEDVDTGPGGVYARLEDSGHVLDHFDVFVSARMPTVEEKSLLQLAEGSPVMAVTRVANTADRPVEVNDIVLDANRYELHYQLAAD